MKHSINLIFLILVLCAQNIYGAQPSSVLVAPLEKMCVNKLFESIHDKEFDYDLDMELMQMRKYRN
jgi:hypothetical protein